MKFLTTSTQDATRTHIASETNRNTAVLPPLLGTVSQVCTLPFTLEYARPMRVILRSSMDIVELMNFARITVVPFTKAFASFFQVVAEESRKLSS